MASKENERRCFLTESSKERRIFALFIASIGHDIGHPGVNNEFLVSFNWISKSLEYR
ncbi:MAG TPA: hypothetical protein VGO47_12820 [Chlamydiales bacterium]|nr:hypothetical protein [Chlamydiales bacterium]